MAVIIEKISVKKILRGNFFFLRRVKRVFGDFLCEMEDALFLIATSFLFLLKFRIPNDLHPGQPLPRYATT